MKNEEKILEMIKSFNEKLPKFSDGRINYKDSKEAPVLNVFLKYQNEISILKRSDKVMAYKGKWNSVAGFLDEVCLVEKKVLEEIKEETGISESEIEKIVFKDIIRYEDLEIQRTWLIVPVLIELKRKPEIKIDWEHSDYRWIKPQDIKKYDIVPGLDETLKAVLN